MRTRAVPRTGCRSVEGAIHSPRGTRKLYAGLIVRASAAILAHEPAAWQLAVGHGVRALPLSARPTEQQRRVVGAAAVVVASIIEVVVVTSSGSTIRVVVVVGRRRGASPRVISSEVRCLCVIRVGGLVALLARARGALVVVVGLCTSIAPVTGGTCATGVSDTEGEDHARRGTHTDAFTH